MERKTFTEYFNLYKDRLKDVDNARLAKVDLIEFNDTLYKSISILWKSILTEEGIDWLEWFYYEKYDFIKDETREDIKAWNSDKKEICQDLDALYDYLVENKYFSRLFGERT